MPETGFDWLMCSKFARQQPFNQGGLDRLVCFHASNGQTRVRAKREQLKTFLPESQGQNLAVTVLYVPCSLDSGLVRVGQGGLDRLVCFHAANGKSQTSPKRREYHFTVESP